MNIWILESDSGITLVYKPYMDFPVNEDLVSGLLTALNQFTIVEFKQGIDSIEMGGLRWVYIQDKDTNLLFIGADSKEVRGDILRARLEFIRQTFIQQYAQEKDRWQGKWTGNVEIYRPFENVIDQFYTQWKQVENIETVAEFFDILGIFQQILNLIFNVIEGHLSTKKKNKIYNLIQIEFDSYLKLDIVKNNPELSEITFQRKAGINIININPHNCDMPILKREIINLIKNVVETLKTEQGYFPSLKFFIEDNIFDYLLSNFSMLNDFKLFIPLIQLFLIK